MGCREGEQAGKDLAGYSAVPDSLLVSPALSGPYLVTDIPTFTGLLGGLIPMRCPPSFQNTASTPR